MNIKDFYAIDGEKPLDRICADGGFSSIFRTIACIGDSLSSGEFESTDKNNGGKNYHDMFEYSWGQFIARTTGAKVYNFSRGGMTVHEYLDFWGENTGAFNTAKAAQAYIIALGSNDLISQRGPVGSASDVDANDPDKCVPDTFAGRYGKLIHAYKKISPRARFFLMPMPREKDDKNDEIEVIISSHAKVLRDIAGMFDNTYVIDFNKYAPIYDAQFKKNFYLGGHLNPAGYALTAKMTMSYIDYIIRHNPRAFSDIGFIGTDLYNTSL